MQIVEQSPWVQSKALYVLATAQKGNDNFMTYSLKTRVSQPEQEDELSRVSLDLLCSDLHIKLKPLWEFHSAY